MKKEELSRYLYVAIIAALIFLSYLIIKPYAIPIISAFILAYLSKPLYERLARGMPRSIAALGTIAFVIVITLVPIASIVGGLINQATSTIKSSTMQEYVDNLENVGLVQLLNLDIEGLLDQGLSNFIEILTNVTTHIPSIFIAFFITLFGMYYLLIDWERVTKGLTVYLPVRNKSRLASEIAQVSRSLVYGTLLIALIEFVLGIIGFYLAGVKYFLLLPALIAIFAFVPGLGPMAVWIPTAIILVAQQNWPGALIITVTGFILTIFVDNILRIRITGKAASTHPLVMLVGIFGGITLFGAFGFIIGPLLLSYTMKIVQEVAEEMR